MFREIQGSEAGEDFRVSDAMQMLTGEGIPPLLVLPPATPRSLILKRDTSVGTIQLSTMGSEYYTPQQEFFFSSCREIGFHYNSQLSERTI